MTKKNEFTGGPAAENNLTQAEQTLIKVFLEMEPLQRKAVTGYVLAVADALKGGEDLPVISLEEALQHMSKNEKVEMYRGELLKEKETGIPSVTRRIMEADAFGNQKGRTGRS